MLAEVGCVEGAASFHIFEHLCQIEVGITEIWTQLNSCPEISLSRSILPFKGGGREVGKEVREGRGRGRGEGGRWGGR